MMAKAIARASEIYAAQGVTTADQGGTLLHPLERGFRLDEAAAARMADAEADRAEADRPLSDAERDALRRTTLDTLRTALEKTVSDQVRRWPVEHSAAGHLFEFQNAVHSGDLPIRVIIHPLGGELMGELNRDFLGWDSSPSARRTSRRPPPKVRATTSATTNGRTVYRPCLPTA